MNPVETYIKDLRDIHSTGAGVKEASFYGALEALFNELGKKLKPRVRCIVQLSNQGAGLPDGGLFTQEQFQRAADLEPRPGQKPSRGAIEVKSPGEEIQAIVDSKQVADYLKAYRQVLVTNLREFQLVIMDPASGQPAPLEGYSLAASVESFWRLCAAPRDAVARHGERLAEYLTRVMLHAAPLAEPKDVAWFLASYAREARARLELPALDPLPAIRAALEDALGIRFSGEKGEHFFRSTFVQTLFYGVFSAWVLWSKQAGGVDPAARYRWKDTAEYLHVPFLRALYYQLANPGPLKDLGLTEVLGWAEQVLNRVDRPNFFAAFEEGQAVQYFYEPFLEAFDPALRKDLGVWYTPPEVVQYMVARVDTVLREELGIPDGLADEQVYVLDPCCGTGAYLVEVLKRIAATLRAKGADALLAQDLKTAALERVIGFEILTAPFVVAHLQLGLLLSNLGAPLRDDETERVGVYLTNALTGWEPPSGPKASLPFREFEEERDAADAVKRERPILVVLGNPPYNAFAGVSPAEEQGLVDVYKEGLNKPVEQGGWGIKKFNLDDLYVRFFRLAERRIAEKLNPGRGVVCFISNFSYLSDPSFVVMRQSFLKNFNRLWFDCLNGDSRETGKLTPQGEPDPSVFSTEYNREGIRVGTTIGLLLRNHNKDSMQQVRYRDFWGSSKLSELLASLTQISPESYINIVPTRNNRLSFEPSVSNPEYDKWPSVVEFCHHAPIHGLSEKRRGALIDWDTESLASRIMQYLDPDVKWEKLVSLGSKLTQKAGRFEPEQAREKIIGIEKYDPSCIVRIHLRPFDLSWCYYSPVRPLWNEPRPALFAQLHPTNIFFVARMVQERPHENIPITITKYLPDHHLLRPNIVAIPIWFNESLKSEKRSSNDQLTLALSSDVTTIKRKANLSAISRDYLESLSFVNPDDDPQVASLVWVHALAVNNSAYYLTENADGIKADWPRVPLPASKDALLASADLGRRLAALLDPENPVPGVTTGAVRPELRTLAAISRDGGGQLDPGAGDLAVTAGWGHAGQGGVTMPGKGRAVERAYTPGELAALQKGAEALGLTPEEALDLLGHTTLDVYLNDRAFWRNVPENVWAYTIGGYQVIKKWLSYRERPLLGRDLKPGEMHYVSEVARRIAAIVLLGPALDANYRAVKKNTYAWESLKHIG
ncbi:MAG: N-6 DNA methylase [Deltaproteobacteria bacterium]|nr:N-6 DNA methylase [Deltaproteobacteria bacterium]